MTRTRTWSGGHQRLLIGELRTPKEIFRDIRNYLAGQLVGATRDDALLEEVLKCLFCKLVTESGKEEALDLSVGAFDIAKQVRGVFAAVRADFPEIYPPDSEILLDPGTLRYVMTELDFSIMDAQSDPIGDAFEVFVGSESRGRAGQFFTPRSVTNLLVEAVDPQPDETILDPACGAGGFLASACAHLIRQGLAPKDLAEVASRNLYGIDKDSYLAQLAKVHIALLTGAHPRIINGDSISLHNGEKGIRERLPKEGVDVILTNPPFGVRIVAATPGVLGTFDLARHWVEDPATGTLQPSNALQANVPPQVLFVERCVSLLRPGGRIGMVLPESVLSNKSYRHVVQYLMRHVHVHGVMGMPESLFKTSGKGGTHTKTDTVASLQMIFSPSGPGLDDISAKRISWRDGHGWPWKLCGRSHGRHRACRGSPPAADHQTVPQLSTTLLPPMRTPGVSASDGPSDAPRSGRPDVRAAAQAGGNLLATSLSGLWTLFQRRYAGPGLAERPLHPPCHTHSRPSGG